MHTFSNKIINPSKLSLLKYKTSYKASEIVKYLIEHNIEFVKNSCTTLYCYYKYIYDENNSCENEKSRC